MIGKKLLILVLVLAPFIDAAEMKCNPRPLAFVSSASTHTARSENFGGYALTSDSVFKEKGKIFSEVGYILTHLQSGATCQADEGITENVYVSQDLSHLIFISYSGSETTFRTVRVKDCREMDRLKDATGFSIAKNQLTLTHVGKTFDLGNDCRFHRRD